MTKLLSQLKKKFLMSDQIQLAVKGIGYQFFDKLIKVVGGFFIYAWMVRYLGPEDMGVFTFVRDFIGIFVLIVTFGMNEVLVNHLVICRDDKKKIGEVLGTVFVFRFVLAIISWLLVSLVIPFFSTSTKIQFLTAVSAWLLLGFAFQTFISFYFSRVKIKDITIASQAAWILANVLKVVGIFLRMEVLYFIFCYNIQTVMDKVICFFQFVIKFDYKLRFNFQLLKEMIIPALPMAITAFLVFFETRTGTFFVNYFLGTKEVGYYGAALSLTGVATFFPVSIISTIYPMILKKIEANNFEKMDYHLVSLYSITWIISLSFALIFYYFADVFVLFLFLYLTYATQKVVRLRSLFVQNAKE